MQIKSFTVAFIGHLFLTRWKKYDGQVMSIVMMSYAIGRYIVEFFRGDYDRGWIPYTHQLISTSQGISLVIFAIGLFALVYHKRHAPLVGTGVVP